MLWNWELPDWPDFTYKSDMLAKKEKEFLLSSGQAMAYIQNIGKEDSEHFIIEILSLEGLESSKIEGEILDRESLQSWIKKHFELIPNKKKESIKESGMAKLLCDVYKTFNTPLSHEKLWKWYSNLFENQNQIIDIGKYRTHNERMQIVSNRYDTTKIFF